MTPEQLHQMRATVKTADRLAEIIANCESCLTALRLHRCDFRVEAFRPGYAHMPGNRMSDFTPRGLEETLAVMEQDLIRQIADAKAELDAL